jgi:hypothetical protein
LAWSLATHTLSFARAEGGELARSLRFSLARRAHTVTFIPLILIVRLALPLRRKNRLTWPRYFFRSVRPSFSLFG